MPLNEEQNKLFEENENLVYATVHRRFSNPRFHETHGLTKDDLFQYGLIGLYNACKNYDPERNTKFSSYAISNIVWSINTESRRDSLSNIDNESFDLLDKTSLDKTLYESEHGETTMHDVLEYREDGFDEFELSKSIESADEAIGKGLSEIIRLRLEGYTYEEVGEIVGMTHQGVGQRLRRNKDKILEHLLN